MKVLGLIPTRIGSSRLPAKPLLKINNIPLVIHTYKRAKMSKLLDDVIICCDDKKITDIANKFNSKSMLTSKKNKNGTERIYEAYKKINKKYDLIVDIQGDEPLINPKHIDEVVKFHKANKQSDIILPHLKILYGDNNNIVKVLTDIHNNVLYLSRSKLPLEFKSINKFYKKHLSIISFKPSALKKFNEFNKTPLEKSEDVELLRALEIGLKIKSFVLKGDSFSIDVFKDYKKAIEKFKKDKISKNYR
jgi:3-deoxy-manno-octulosonate cytidylyltransferase (CMP-KDO synthetase)